MVEDFKVILTLVDLPGILMNNSSQIGGDDELVVQQQ
jgi:hypothetical protein